MNKQKFKKFRKNDWSDEEGQEDHRDRKDKRKERRFDRAIRTRDISAFNEDEENNSWETNQRAWIR